MTKLFIYTPLFRFITPVFSGVIAYLLILLLNNNIIQLQEQFLGQELYVCITLSYIVHEFSLLLIWVFKFLSKISSTLINLLIHLLISSVFGGFLITVLVQIYYQVASGYSVSKDELLMFNGVYISIPISYVLLNISHQYLFKVNTKKLNNQLLIKQNIEEDFKQFKREMNPDLLFESFEHLLALIGGEEDKVDEFVDHLSAIYRYILSSKKEQLIAVKEEIEIVNELIKLYNHLPYRKVNLTIHLSSDFLIIPGTLLFVIEKIIKTTIVSSKDNLNISILNNTSTFTIEYLKEDKILEEFNFQSIKEITNIYSIYTTKTINVLEADTIRKISFPILKIKS